MLGGGYSDQISAGLTKWYLFWRHPPADLKKINKYINKNFFLEKSWNKRATSSTVHTAALLRVNLMTL